MKNKYPFSPKSNLKLEIGQFWAIELNNGGFGCGIILDIPKKEVKSTKMVFVGLLNWVGAQKPTVFDLESNSIILLDQGNVHIKTINWKNEPIIGKIDFARTNIILPIELDCTYFGNVVRGYDFIRKANKEDEKKFNTQSTWGFEVIYSIANKFLCLR